MTSGFIEMQMWQGVKRMTFRAGAASAAPLSEYITLDNLAFTAAFM